MMHVKKFIDLHLKNLDRLEKLSEILPDLFVDLSGDEEVKFVTTDYLLADKISIDYAGSLYRNQWIINFGFDVTVAGKEIKILCRHDGWKEDDRRIAEQYLDDPPYNTLRHNIDELIAFYHEKGAREFLLNKLRNDLENRYEKPSSEQLASEEEGDWPL